MLTISKPLSSGQAQTYHAKEFTAAEQNYWKQGNEIVGEWQGRMAVVLGLAEGVAAEDLLFLATASTLELRPSLFNIGRHRSTRTRRVRQ